VKVYITNNIRKLRFEADGMTQQELADKAEVTRQTIVSMERGSYSPSLELAYKITQIFNKKIEDVFTFETKEA
jgi:putative transcriptional regulator